MTTTSVSKANGVNKRSTDGQKYTSSKRHALSSQLLKRLTRLAGWVPSGLVVATLGSWVLLLPTRPLRSAASGVKGLATVPVGWPGYHCVRASRMARYLRRWSLLAAPSGLVGLSSESIRWDNLLSACFKMTGQSVR